MNIIKNLIRLQLLIFMFGFFLGFNLRPDMLRVVVKKIETYNIEEKI
jgi:hypothetical protein